MFSPSRSSSEKAISLAGPVAVDWASARGLDMTGESARARLVADAYRAPEFVIIRLWTDARRVQRSEREPDGLVITIATEEPVIVRTDGQQHLLEKGDAVITPTLIAEQLSSDGPLGFIQVYLKQDALVRFGLRSVASVRVARGATSPVMVLASLVNSTLIAMNQMKMSWVDTKASVEAGVASVLRLVDARDGLASLSGSRLFDDALLLIHEYAVDPTFSVSRLADLLRISERRLQEVFAAHGSSPRTAIGRRRLQSAMQILSQYPTRDATLLAEVAHASGFPSVRALREAMRRAEADPEPKA